MAGYEMTWITKNLAVAHAPMSYAELNDIRARGIDAIVNLCGEYCDLHEIERKHGFEVYYLPMEDEHAPQLEALEKALDWLDEAIYLGKKVLVHCRFGIGRTGTFVTSYLLRRGFGYKLAQQRLKPARSKPTSFDQWWFLKKYGRRAGKITIREPSLEGNNLVDLGPYFSQYEALLEEADAAFRSFAQVVPGLTSCGAGSDACCSRFLYLQFAEAAYLMHCLNKYLSREDRLAAIGRAVAMGKTDCAGSRNPAADSAIQCANPGQGQATQRDEYRCPLNVAGECIMYANRPVVCRVYGIPVMYRGRLKSWGLLEDMDIDATQVFSLDRSNEYLRDISRSLFFALNSAFLEDKSLLFPLTHVVSGKFVQDYFMFLNQLVKQDS